MAKLGAFCFPGTGHINPMTALMGRLQQLGHEVVFFGIADTEARVRAHGIPFHLIGERDYPPGTLDDLDRRLSEMSGLAAFHFTLDRVRNTARMVLRDGPAAVRAEGVDAMLVDQVDFAGSVADFLGIPFISIAILPPMEWDNRIPPFYLGWKAGQDPLSRLRNELVMMLLSKVAAAIFGQVNEQRKEWGIEPFRHSWQALSPWAKVTQLPDVLEFQVGKRAPKLYYTGPWVDPLQRPWVDFPWDRLDGRPLIYASLGTLQNGAEAMFRTIAAACAGLDVQTVISLGGGLDPERLGPLPGNPIVVGFAPQLELVKRAAVVITHAGINTVLESLSEGVPMVAVPLGNDQPGVAARLAACGAGIVVHRRKASEARLRSAVKAVIEEPRYRQEAQRIQAALSQIDGLGMAAQAVEDGLRAAFASKEPTVQASCAVETYG